MKKVIIMVTVIVMVIAFVGCGKDTKETKKDNDSNVEEILFEDIIVEDIIVEEIQVEEIQIEYIDDEYENESDYNSKVNTWENSTTYWD